MRPVQRTMATRVLRERVLALSWGSALLLHVAEPRIAQGVADHSVFLNDPTRRVARLYSTANTMLDLLVGGRPDMDRAATRINAIHDRVHGLTPELGPDALYSAHDPTLLAWVHVALHATLLRAYQDLVGPLSVPDQDQYCREVTSIEPLLGIPDGRLPRDVCALKREFETRVACLRVGDNARRIARGIVSPSLPRWLSPATGLAHLCTLGFLPARVRKAYGLAWSPRRQRPFRASVRVLRGLLRVMPARLRFAPPELMLRWAPADAEGGR